MHACGKISMTSWFCVSISFHCNSFDDKYVAVELYVIVNAFGCCSYEYHWHTIFHFCHVFYCLGVCITPQYTFKRQDIVFRFDCTLFLGCNQFVLHCSCKGHQTYQRWCFSSECFLLDKHSFLVWFPFRQKSDIPAIPIFATQKRKMSN